MLHSKTFKDYLQEYALIVVGSVIYAAGFRFFYYPNDIIAGGVTGIAMIINYLTEIPVGVINIVINIPLFILAWRAFGLKFIVGSFVATMLSSVLMDVFALIPISVTDNLLLAAIYGGVIYGLGLGLIYRAGDTTGGIDIVAKFVRRKYPYINFGTIILILDVIIIAAFALIFNQYEAAMYAIIGMFIVAFLAIHPFQDGNSRLSRALTILLLLRSGYVYVPYSSLESIIETTKQSYYIALRTTQKTLQTAEPNWNVWLTYFLQSLVKQVRHLKTKIENEHLLKSMPEISLRIIEQIRTHGSLSITEAESLLKINKFTLRDHFKRLTAEGHLLKTGNGRATRYILKI